MRMYSLGVDASIWLNHTHVSQAHSCTKHRGTHTNTCDELSAVCAPRTYGKAHEYPIARAFVFLLTTLLKTQFLT